MHVQRVLLGRIMKMIRIFVYVIKDTKGRPMTKLARNASWDSTKILKVSATAQPAQDKISRHSSQVRSCATIAHANPALAFPAMISTTKTPRVHRAHLGHTRAAMGARRAASAPSIPRRMTLKAWRLTNACVCPATRATATRRRRVQRALSAPLKMSLATRRVHCATPQHRRRSARPRRTRKTACARLVFTTPRPRQIRARRAC